MIKYVDSFYYINEVERELVKRGLAKYDLHSLHFSSLDNKKLTQEEYTDVLDFLLKEHNKNIDEYPLDLFYCGYFRFDIYGNTLEERYDILNKIKSALNKYNKDLLISIQYTIYFDTEN